MVDLHTDDAENRFAPGATVTLEDGTGLTVSRFDPTDRSPVVTFTEMTDRSTAESRRGMGLFVAPDSRRALAADEFWPDELVGLSVVTPDDAEVGEVSDVDAGSAQARLVVVTPSGPILIPLVAALVPVVDLEAGRVVVDLPPGFMD